MADVSRRYCFTLYESNFAVGSESGISGNEMRKKTVCIRDIAIAKRLIIRMLLQEYELYLFPENYPIKHYIIMTKADIVKEVADKTGIEKTVVMTVVESFMESVKGSMIKRDEVFLRGFGSFIIKKRAEKVARNISKNTTITIPAHEVPAFKPAKSFLDAVRESK